MVRIVLQYEENTCNQNCKSLLCGDFNLGQRTFRIAAVSQRDGYGQSNVAVYEIRLPKINDPMDTATITLLTPHSFQHNDNSIGGQPPPPFCIAINMPSPISTHTFNTELRACDPYISIECPVLPPTYNDVVSIARSSGSKLPVENVFV